MAEDIGYLWQTKIPSFSETADIQEALRLYHYGAPSGVGSGEYDTTNSNPSLLVENFGVATHLQNHDDRIEDLEAESAISLKQTTFDAKGDLLSSSAANTLEILSLGTTGQVLTVNTSTDSGLEWALPEVTENNIVELTNKTIDLSSNTLTGTIAEFNIALSDGQFATLAGEETLLNKNIELVAADNFTNAGSIAWDNTNKKLQVGDGSVIWEISSSTIKFNKQTGTTYTLVESDKDKLVELSNTAAISLIVPGDNSLDYPEGTTINLLQTNTGQVSLIGGVVTSDDYGAGGASAATTVTTLTYDTLFTPQLTINGTNLVAGTRVTAVAPGVVTTGTFDSGGASSATTFNIRENRTNLVVDQLVTGTNIPANTLVTDIDDINLYTAIRQSGGASGATTVVLSTRLIEPTNSLVFPSLSGTISAITSSLSGSFNTTQITGITSTTGITVGMVPTKISGSGAFGANAIVYSVDSATSITILHTTSMTSGSITFSLGDRILPIAGQKISGTGLAGDHRVSSVSEPTAITTQAFGSGGASGARFFNLSAANANIFAGQRINGTGTGSSNYILGISGTTVVLSTALSAQAAGTYSFFGSQLTFSPAATGAISGTITFTGETITISNALTGQASGSYNFNGTQLTFTPATSGQVAGTIEGRATINGTPGTKIRTQWSPATLIKREENLWVVLGDVIS